MIDTGNERFSVSLTDLLHTSGRSVFVLNEYLYCLQSSDNDLLAEGECLREFLCEDNTCIISDDQMYTYYRNGVFRCVRLFCIRRIGQENIYLCELISRKEAEKMLRKTDRLTDTTIFFGRMEHSLSELWKNVSELPEDSEIRTAIKNELYRLSAAEESLFESVGMDNAPAVNVVFDISRLFGQLVERCNKTLVEIGRSIVLDDLCGAPVYICADSRRAVTAFVDLIQAALICTPVDIVPVISLYKGENKSCGSAVISVRLINDRLLLQSREGNSIAERNIWKAFGIAERFAAATGGSFVLRDDHGETVAVLSLPAATAEDIAMCRLEEPSAAYDSIVPDIAEIKMREFLELY